MFALAISTTACKKDNDYDCYVYTFGLNYGTIRPPETYCGPDGDHHDFKDEQGRPLSYYVRKK